MATHCVLPIEETVDAGADGDSIRQRPRARRTNSSGDGSSQYAHSHQFSSGDGVAAHAAMISDHPGRQHRQSSESYANRTHTESPVDQPDEAPLETDSELQQPLTVMVTPRQEMRFDDSEESYNVMPSLSMLRIDLPDQETLLQPSLELFTSLAEPNLLSPPLSPLLQDRELNTALHMIYYECDSPVDEEDTMQSQHEVGGTLSTRVRQERVMCQERYDSEEFRCMESTGKLKHWDSHTFADIL